MTDPQVAAETEALRDRFRGALLGTMIGDALGMPVEGWTADRIRAAHGELREMLPARMGSGSYTDDTELTIGLAEALLEAADGVDPDLVAQRFAANYDPRRGYGANASRVLEAVRAGEPWREAAASHKPPGGSWGNGAAMRVAPVALRFYGDADAVAEAAESQAEVTGHTHAIGRFGARLQARAVHRALERGMAGASYDVRGFVDDVIHAAPPAFVDPLRWLAEHAAADPVEARVRLGVGGRASQSVPAALWAFAAHQGAAEDAVVAAVGLGGDTDTIGAMAGALAGAYRGVRAFPARWLNALERGERGRDHVLHLADRLLALRSG